MRQSLKSLDNRGFTLVESLFQLILFAVFVQLFLLFFLWKAPIERNYTEISNTAWELFAADMQDVLVDIHGLEVHTNGQGVRLWNHRGRVDVEYRNAVIRKAIEGQGHIPLLTNVQSTHFTLKDSTVLVQVTMRDGTRKERDFAIGILPE